MTSGRWRLSSAEAAALAAILVAAFAIRVGLLPRPGLSVDEDITMVVVQAIDTHGLPRLASGVIYDRGLPYSYLAWIGSEIWGPSIVTYRALALAFGLCAIAAAWRVTRTLLDSPSAGLLSAALLAVLPLHVEQSVWARFYSLFCFLYLLTLLTAIRAMDRRAPLWHVVVLAALCRSSHELGATVVLIPLAYAAAGWPDRDRLKRAAAGLVAAAAGALTSAGLLARLRAAGAPQFDEALSQDITVPGLYLARMLPDGAVYLVAAVTIALVASAIWLRRAEWALLGPVAGCAVAGEMGVATLAAACALLMSTPSRVRIFLASVVLAGTALIGWTLVVAYRLQMPLFEVLAWLLPLAFRYPLSEVAFVAGQLPVISILLGLSVTALYRRGDRIELRTLLFLAVAWFVTTSVGRHGFPSRYIAVVAILSAPAAAGASLLLRSQKARIVLASLAVAAVVVASGGRYRPETYDHPSLASLRSALPDRVVVICNHDVTTMVYLGRCDYQLGSDQRVVGEAPRQRTRLLGTPLLSSFSDAAPFPTDREIWMVVVRAASASVPDRSALEQDARRAGLHLELAGEDADTTIFRIRRATASRSSSPA